MNFIPIYEHQSKTRSTPSHQQRRGSVKPKLHADRIEYWEDPATLTKHYYWTKKGKLVKEAIFTEEQLSLTRYPICKSCLVFRGELQQMNIKVESDNLPDYKCPICNSLYFAQQYCSCGEKPHRVNCIFGFINYFPLS